MRISNNFFLSLNKTWFSDNNIKINQGLVNKIPNNYDFFIN